MSALDQIRSGVCPNCHGTAIKYVDGYFTCRACGVNGNPETMRWCERAPVFNRIRESELWRAGGELYKAGDEYFVLAGYAPGCGRPLTGAYCDSCRSFLPAPWRKESRSSGGADAEARL